MPPPGRASRRRRPNALAPPPVPGPADPPDPPRRPLSRTYSFAGGRASGLGPFISDRAGPPPAEGPPALPHSLAGGAAPGTRPVSRRTPPGPLRPCRAGPRGSLGPAPLPALPDLLACWGARLRTWPVSPPTVPGPLQRRPHSRTLSPEGPSLAARRPCPTARAGSPGIPRARPGARSPELPDLFAGGRPSGLVPFLGRPHSLPRSLGSGAGPRTRPVSRRTPPGPLSPRRVPGDPSGPPRCPLSRTYSPAGGPSSGLGPFLLRPCRAGRRGAFPRSPVRRARRPRDFPASPPVVAAEAPAPAGRPKDSPVCGAGKYLGSKGLVSADRSEGAALLGTTPRSIPKSSASDRAARPCGATPPPLRWPGGRGRGGRSVRPGVARRSSLGRAAGATTAGL